MKKTKIRFWGIGAIITLALGLITTLLVFWHLPDVRRMKNCLITSMYQVNLCPKSSDYRSLGQIAGDLAAVVVLSEDAAFYAHQGLDWFEIKNSITTNWQRGKFARGGSTITQQLVKNVFLGPEKSLLRKLKEVYLTYQVEKYFSKKEILERYLNVVEFGPGIFGVTAAAKYYFKKSPAQLNLLESAYLAFLLPSPITHHQYFQKRTLTSYARKRIAGIVRRALLHGKIANIDYRFAQSKIDAFPWHNLVWMPGPEFLGTDPTIHDDDTNGDQEIDQELEQLVAPTIAPSEGAASGEIGNNEGGREGDQLPPEYL